MQQTGPLPRIELAERLSALPDWSMTDRGLAAAYRFESASTALEFIVQVGLRCEQDKRYLHLDWHITTVSLCLAQGQREKLTERDLQLARHVSSEAARLEAQVITTT